MLGDRLETLGERIRKLRHERRLSLARVAGEDFSRAFLNQVELGKSQPSTRVLRVIAARLGAPIDYLLEGSTPFIDREIAVERARLRIAAGQHRRAVADLQPALEADWPLGSDARVTLAAALLGLDKREQALLLLETEEVEIRGHDDEFRLGRLRAVRDGKPHQLGPNGHLRIAEAAIRAGRSAAALEHYRAARILAEAEA